MSAKFLLHISIAGEDSDLDPGRYDRLDETGDDARWFGNRLEELGLLDSLEFSTAYVFEGEALPEPSAVDAVLLGGSWPSINERLPWQLSTMEWLARYRGTGRPLLGVCGGHQMVSALRGARVEPIGAEPFVGSYPLSLTEAGRRHCLFEGYSSKPKFHFGNYERVVAPPDGAILLASSEAFDVAALDHGGGWLTVQFHPEASHEAMAVDYRITHPHLAGNYEPLPQAPKLLANFLKGAGVVGEARVVRGRRPAR